MSDSRATAQVGHSIGHASARYDPRQLRSAVVEGELFAQHVVFVITLHSGGGGDGTTQDNIIIIMS